MVATEQRYAESIVVETFGLSAHHLSGRHDLVGNAFIAAAEGFFGRLKNELFYGRDWRGVGYEEFRERLAAYLTHYNETRIKKSLDWMSPVQYRRSLGLAA